LDKCTVVVEMLKIKIQPEQHTFPRFSAELFHSLCLYCNFSSVCSVLLFLAGWWPLVLKQQLVCFFTGAK
jgi:hypothetical protein